MVTTEDRYAMSFAVVVAFVPQTLQLERPSRLVGHTEQDARGAGDASGMTSV
jgi:hypothetical protein